MLPITIVPIATLVIVITITIPIATLVIIIAIVAILFLL